MRNRYCCEIVLNIICQQCCNNIAASKENLCCVTTGGPEHKRVTAHHRWLFPIGQPINQYFPWELPITINTKQQYPSLSTENLCNTITNRRQCRISNRKAKNVGPYVSVHLLEIPYNQNWESQSLYYNISTTFMYPYE